MVEGLQLVNGQISVRSLDPLRDWKAVRTKVLVTPTSNYCEVKIL